jgi:hypothetical protein
VDTLLPFDAYLNLAAPIARLYLGWFDRLPDADGLHHWIRQHHQGLPIEAIAEAFAGAASPDIAAGNEVDFVRCVYQRLLQRAPDAAGEAHFAGELTAGRTTRAALMLSFSQCDEAIGRWQPTVTLCAAYIGVLGRAPTAPELEDGLARFARGDAEDLIIADLILADTPPIAA